MRVKRKVIFVLVMAAIQVAAYFAFTVSGFMRIYNYALERSIVVAGEDERTDEEHLSAMYGDRRGDVLFLNRKVEGNAVNFDELWLNTVYLRRFYQIRYIAIDCGYAEGQLLNEYMASGNKGAVDRIVAGFESGELRSAQFREYIDRIAGINSEAAESSRLLFVGIAPETDAALVKRYVRKILGRTSGRTPASEIESAVTQGTRTDRRYILNLAKSVDKYPNLYRQLLVENFYEFVYTVKCFDDEPDPRMKNRTCAANFAEFLDRNTKAVCLMQYSAPSLITEIFELRPDLKNRSSSYEVRYMNCQRTIPGSRDTLTIAPEARISDGSQRMIYWDNQYLRWLEGYRRFVYRINRRDAGRYDIDPEGDGLFLLLCDSAPLEEFVIPDDGAGDK